MLIKSEKTRINYEKVSIVNDDATRHFDSCGERLLGIHPLSVRLVDAVERFAVVHAVGAPRTIEHTVPQPKHHDFRLTTLQPRFQHGDEICAVGLCAEVEREALRADGCGGIGHAHAAASGTGRDKWQFTFVLTDTEGKNALDGIVYSPSKAMDSSTLFQPCLS